MLSEEEVERYFPKESDRKAYLTDFEIAHNYWFDYSDGLSSKCWATRTRGVDEELVFVDYKGDFKEANDGGAQFFEAESDYRYLICVRPAMWIDLSKIELDD